MARLPDDPYRPSLPVAVLEAVERLAASSEFLRAQMDAHIRDNGEVLPHVYMADVTLGVEGAALAGDVSTVRSVLDSLEQALSEGGEGADQIEGVVAVSFLEYLDDTVAD